MAIDPDLDSIAVLRRLRSSAEATGSRHSQRARFAPPKRAVAAVSALVLVAALAAAVYGLSRVPELTPVPERPENTEPQATPTASDPPAAEPTASPEAEGGLADDSKSDAPESGAPGAADSKIFVYVVGAVGQPGVVDLNAGDRVFQAIDAAGGPKDNADVARVNQARKVVDGERVYVPKHGEKLPAGNDGRGPESDPQASPLVNLNSASGADLETLPGIGEAISERIISWRSDHGSFSRVEELLEVEGIGPSTLEDLKDKVTV